MTLLVDPVLFAEDRQVEYDPTDTKALRALERASALVRSLAAQTFSRVADDMVELVGNPTSDLYLPERPVVSVKDISIRTDAVTVDVPLTAVDLRPRGLLRMLGGGSWGGDRAAVALTYTHGYEVIPDDVVETVLSIAARKFAETIATPDLPTAAGLTADELAVVRRYRP